MATGVWIRVSGSRTCGLGGALRGCRNARGRTESCAAGGFDDIKGAKRQWLGAFRTQVNFKANLSATRDGYATKATTAVEWSNLSTFAFLSPEGGGGGGGGERERVKLSAFL